MNLSNDLVNKFVEITNDETPNKEGSTAYGVTVQYGDRMYVKLDGSDLLTPVETTSAIKSGERVTVLIKDHNATVTGNLSDPSASSKDLTDIGDKIAEVDILIADKVDTKILIAETARIEEMIATKASIGELEADRAEIEYLKANKAWISDLEASNAHIGILDSDLADIQTLINGHLTTDNMQSLILTSDKVTVQDAFIKDAMIDNISAGKITSGKINTSLVSISSEDGSMTLNGSTQQFRDSNGVVRIQIGKDADGNFTFCLFSQDGVGVLLDEEGLHAGAVPDGLIVNDMVADNANISGGKLDINSVITSINNGTTSIDSSKIYLDDVSQSLKVAFDSLKTKVETIEEVTVNGELTNVIEQITNNTTNINVMQGQISSLIYNTTITTQNGEVIQLKDDYNSTKSTVNSQSTKIGSLETNFNNLSIGGENLVKNSKTLSSIINQSNMWQVVDSEISGHKQIELDTTNTNWVEVYLPLYPPINTLSGDLTISFEYTESEPDLLVVNLGVFNEGGRKAEISNTFVTSRFTTTDIGNGWKRAYFVENRIETINNIPEALEYRLQIKKVSNMTGSIKIRKIQVEKGNKATDYSPSVEDTNSQLTSVISKQASMELDLDGFRTDVSRTYATKQDVNNISVGGENLYTGSKDFSYPSGGHAWYGGNGFILDTETYQGCKIWRHNDAWNGRYQQVPLEIGETYTLSAWVRGDGASKIECYGNFSECTTINFTRQQVVPTSWTRVAFTFVSNGTNSSRFENIISGTNLDICGLKLERGNRATDYSLNIFDIESTYTTKTELVQTSEDFTFRISQSGGGNLLKNSLFKDGTRHWSFDTWDGQHLTNITHYYWEANSGEWSHGSRRSFTAFNAYGHSGAPANSIISNDDWCDVVPGDKYSYSFYCRQHRCLAYVEIKGLQFDGNYRTITAFDILNPTGGDGNDRTFSTWCYTGNSFTIPSDIKAIKLWIVITQHDGTGELNSYFWLAEPCITRASMPVHWCPHESEVYDGIVKIDNTGLTVQHGSNRSVLDSDALNFYAGDVRYSRVRGGKFEFTDSSGNIVGDVGKSTWSGTNRVLSSLNGRYGHSVGLGVQTTEGGNYNCPLVLCTQNGELSTGGGYYYQGVNISNPKVSGTMVVRGSTNDTVDLNLQGMMLFSNYGNGYRTGNIFGNEEIHLGTLYGSELWDGFIVRETEYSNSKNELHAYGNLYMHYYSINDAYLSNVMSAASTYTTRLLNEGSTDNVTYSGSTFTNGEIRYVHRGTCHTVEEWDYNDEGVWSPLGVYYCYCELPVFMAENIELDYHVNIGKIGWGDYRVIEKNPYLFIVESKEEGFAFTWEVVAKQLEVARNNAVVANEYINTGRSQPIPQDVEEFTYKLDGEEFIEEVEEIQDNIITGGE